MRTNIHQPSCNFSEAATNYTFFILVTLLLVGFSNQTMAQNRSWRNANTETAASDASGNNMTYAIPIPNSPNQPRSWTVRVTEVNGQQVVVLEGQTETAAPIATQPASAARQRVFQDDAAPVIASVPRASERRDYPTSDYTPAVRRASAASARPSAPSASPAPVFTPAPEPSYAPQYATRRVVAAPTPIAYTAPAGTLNGSASDAYANANPYEGRRWKVKAVSYGLASWYGGKYQGRRTANGEIFDMYQYTAAHRTIAFGSKVRVINLKNNKSVIVRINDRGPFTNDGRVIDRAMGAAQDIDLTHAGVAQGKLELLEEDDATPYTYETNVRSTQRVQNPAPAPKATNQNITSANQYPNIDQMMPERYTVQIAAMGDPQRARERANQLNGGWVHSTFVNGNAIYRVNIGRFGSKNEAEQAAQQVRASGMDALVKQIQN